MYVLQIETLTTLITLNACLFVATISCLEIVVSHLILSSGGSLERGLASDVLVWNDVAELLVDLLSAVNHVHKLSALVALVDLARAHDLYMLGVFPLRSVQIQRGQISPLILFSGSSTNSSQWANQPARRGKVNIIVNISVGIPRAL